MNTLALQTGLYDDVTFSNLMSFLSHGFDDSSVLSCLWIKTIFYQESCYILPCSAENCSCQCSFFLLTPVPSCWGNCFKAILENEILVSSLKEETFLPNRREIVVKPKLLVVTSKYLILLCYKVTYYSKNFSWACHTENWTYGSIYHISCFCVIYYTILISPYIFQT